MARLRASIICIMAQGQVEGRPVTGLVEPALKRQVTLSRQVGSEMRLPGQDVGRGRSLRQAHADAPAYFGIRLESDDREGFPALVYPRQTHLISDRDRPHPRA